MVGVHLALHPGGWIEARAVQRLECGLLGFEAHQRALTEGPVDAHARLLRAPADRIALHVSRVEPRLSTEEILPEILDVALDVRFPRRMAHHGGIDHEAAVA